MSTTKIMPRMKAFYNDELRAKLQEKLEIKNKMEVPVLKKIVVNAGLGQATKDGKLLEEITKDLTDITGQKPQVRRAKKAVAQFALREGQAIGLKVTLRGIRMYEFLDRLISVALPRVRDFRGISAKGFGKTGGNYTMGLRDHTVFAEIDIEKVYRSAGMNITFVTTARTPEEGFALLKGFGFPFKEGRDG